MSQNRSPATAHNDGDIVEQEGITHSLCWTPTGDQAELLNSRNGHGNGDVQPTVLNAHPKRAYWDWTASVKSEKYELGRSFSVPFFLGEVPEDPKVWLFCDTFAGAPSVYVDRRASNTSFIVQGFVKLNHSIAQHSGLSSLEPSVVEPYLAQTLQWRVVKVRKGCQFVGIVD